MVRVMMKMIAALLVVLVLPALAFGGDMGTADVYFQVLDRMAAEGMEVSMNEVPKQEPFWANHAKSIQSVEALSERPAVVGAIFDGRSAGDTVVSMENRLVGDTVVSMENRFVGDTVVSLEADRGFLDDEGRWAGDTVVRLESERPTERSSRDFGDTVVRLVGNGAVLAMGTGL